MSPILRRIQEILSPTVMGFFALAALVVAIVPLIFDLSPVEETTLDGIEWLVVGAFVLEYGAGLALAPSRRDYVLQPGKLLDLFVIVAPAATFLPGSPETLRASPALRLLRVARVIVLGTRTTRSIGHGSVTSRRRLQAAPTAFTIRVLAQSKPGEVATLAWEEFVRELAAPEEEWFHVTGVTPAHFAQISKAIGLPEAFLGSSLAEAAHPRVDLFQDYLTLSVWHPGLRTDEATGDVIIERAGTLTVGSRSSLVTLSRASTGLHEAVIRGLKEPADGVPFLVRVKYALFRHILRRYEAVIGHLDRELRRLEDLPVHESSQQFLESTFRLKREIGELSGDLWHFKEILRAFATKRIVLHGFEPKHQASFEIIADEADYLYEAATNIKENVVSLIELHLNVVSFEMNKVMRILAVVTALALIPTVVGGLLGMNLDGNPWPASLTHVTFGVGTGMALALYVFAAKGWLR